MHSDRLILFLLIILVACKASQPITAGDEVYSEDLSYLRPQLETIDQEADTVKAVMVTSSEKVEFPGNIAKELDSINLMIAERNRSVKYEDGFTIQIYTGNDRNAANQASAQARALFPDLEPQISYYQPSYRVKVGQFTNRLVAHKKFEKIRESFPKALLIPERIRINND